jgi:hypothetical protein
VAEGQCTLTRRIGSLMDDASGGWWPVGSPDAVDVALGVIGDRALPWLDRFSSVDAVLRIHQLAPELLAPRPARWPVTLYLSRGRVAEAHAAFVDYLSAGIGPGQVPGLRDWLVERGLTDWEPDLESARVLEL